MRLDFFGCAFKLNSKKEEFSRVVRGKKNNCLSLTGKTEVANGGRLPFKT